MKKKSRLLPYSNAINEAFHLAMAADRSVVLIGQGVKSPWYVGNTATGLLERFGSSRVIDTPVSENAVTGAAVGAALAGMRTVVVHPRMDFMFYAFDPIINEAANWRYMFGGRVSVPLVVWAIINRGGEQAAQHSQALHAMFAHVPGLKVVMPATAYDAKGLLIAAIRDDNPVIFIDERWLYSEKCHVPKAAYAVPIGKGIVRRSGKDLTIVAISYMLKEAMLAADILKAQGIDAEVIDPRTLAPLDLELIVKSVRKTGRLLVADVGWLTGGVSGDIVARVTERAFESLKAAPARLALPDCPAPMSAPLEKAYYPRADDIVEVARNLVRKS
ncbi:MAG: transketolase C-terminal domain-containing protein [Kiritimatiellia bacterium]